MRIATMMSIAVLGLSGAAIAQVTTTPDQDVMQNEMDNNMTAPDNTMGNDVMTNGTDDTDTMLPPTMPDTAPSTLPSTSDTVDSTLPPTPDGTTTTPDDTGATP